MSASDTLVSCQKSIMLDNSPWSAFMFNHQLFDYDLLSGKIYDDRTDVIVLIQVAAHRKQYVDPLVLYFRLLSVVSVSLY